MVESPCNKCGECCRVITMQHSPEEIFKKLLHDPNWEVIFIARNWIPISEKKAMKLNPYLCENLGKAMNGHFFYSCKRWNLETKECTIQDKKPNICTNYPYYGKEELSKTVVFYSETCGYKKEIDKDK